jgi:hypothetical protein
MNGQALGDPLGRTLPQRVIRQIHSGAGNRPGWMGGDAVQPHVANGGNGVYVGNGSLTYNDPAAGIPAPGGRSGYGRNPTLPPDVK